jgi:hypothetical protein
VKDALSRPAATGGANAMANAPVTAGPLMAIMGSIRPHPQCVLAACVLSPESMTAI